MEASERREAFDEVGSVGWNRTNTSPRVSSLPTPYWAVSSKDRERLLGIQDLFDGKGTIRQNSKCSWQWRISGKALAKQLAPLVYSLENRREMALEICRRYGYEID